MSMKSPTGSLKALGIESITESISYGLSERVWATSVSNPVKLPLGIGIRIVSGPHQGY